MPKPAPIITARRLTSGRSKNIGRREATRGYLRWIAPPDYLFASMTRWPHAVMFDFDGVIVNSEPLHYLAFHEVLAAEKIELSEAEYYQELIGFDDRGAFKRLFELRGRDLDPKTFLRVMTRKSETMMELIQRRKLEALPGAEEF